MISFRLLLVCCAGASALIVMPAASTSRIVSSASVVQMSLSHNSRREVLVGAALCFAGSPLQASAKSQVEDDEAVLKQEDNAIRQLEGKINAERKLEKAEKAAIKKKNAEYAAAVKAGDTDQASAVKAKLDTLGAEAAKEEEVLTGFVSEEKKELAMENKQLAKVRAEEDALKPKVDELIVSAAIM